MHMIEFLRYTMDVYRFMRGVTLYKGICYCEKGKPANRSFTGQTQLLPRKFDSTTVTPFSVMDTPVTESASFT